MEGGVVLFSLFFLAFFYFAWNTGFIYMLFIMGAWFFTIFSYHVLIEPLSEKIGFLNGKISSFKEISELLHIIKILEKIIVRNNYGKRKRKHGKK